MNIEQRIILIIPILCLGIWALISLCKDENLSYRYYEGRKFRYENCIIDIKHFIEKLQYNDYVKSEEWKRQKNKGYALKKPICVRDYSDDISLIVDKKG